MPRRTGPKELRRKTATRPERRTIVVFCEGEASEPDYINGLKRLPEVQHNTSVDIEIAPDQGVPLTLVQRAAARKAADDELDEVWCVFDVEWPKNHRPGKRIDPAVYLPHRREACRRSAASGARHRGNGTVFPKDNPSSTMHELLGAIGPGEGAGR